MNVKDLIALLQKYEEKDDVWLETDTDTGKITTVKHDIVNDRLYLYTDQI